MKKKFLATFLSGIVGGSFHANAAGNSQFQNFDDQISVGYGYSSSSLSNPSNLSIGQTFTNNSANLDIERLFDNHIWLDVNGSFTFSSTQSGSNVPFVNNVQTLGFPASLTAKVGYAFPIANTGLQLTPYATAGRVLNYNGVNVPDVGFTNSFYYLYGVGGRAEYIINNSLMVYFDQNAGYLSDQSGADVDTSSWAFNSALGLKYNATSNIQFGVQGFYNHTNVISSTAGYDSTTYTSRNVNQETWGGLVSVGYLYDGIDTSTSSWSDAYTNGGFSAFDNVYSLGYGYAQSNTYSPDVTNMPGVASTLNFLDVNVQRLFLSGVWVDIDAQLMTSITQSNTTSSSYNYYAPTYLTYPGSATVSVGYGFPLVDDHLQVIPYVNGGMVMNVNSYTITEDQDLSYQLSHDMYLQYGAGAKLEYMINKHLELYVNQLFAELDDQSGLGLGVWRSTSTLGGLYNAYDQLQLGLNVFYDQLTSNSSPSASLTSPVYTNQSTVGGMVSVGLRY